MSNVIEFRSRSSDRDRRTPADKAIFMNMDNWHVYFRGWPEITIKRWEAVLRPTRGGWKWGVRVEWDGSDTMWGNVFDEIEDAKVDCWEAVWPGEDSRSQIRRQGGSRP